MKQFFLSIVIMLTITVATAQKDAKQKQSANYEAANWKIWLIDNPNQITIPAPAVPSKSELQIKIEYAQ
jgi:hypothetical protein